MLWHSKVRSVKNSVIVFVLEGSEGFLYYFQGATLIMSLETGDVLQHECFTSMMTQNSHHIVEQSALRRMIKTLPFANRAEWLAGESGEKDVKPWYISFVNLRDVTMREFPKICLVRSLGVFVPLGGEDALSVGFLERDSHAANSSDKINELEIFGGFFLHVVTENLS